MKNNVIFGVFVALLYFSGQAYASSTKWCPIRKNEDSTVTCEKKCKQLTCTSFGHGKYTGRSDKRLVNGRLTTLCSCEYNY